MDVDSFRALLGAGDSGVVGHAVAALDAGADLVTVATKVRARFPELAAPVAALAVTQARLRRRARAKFGDDADRMWFTPDGLEQATRTAVARHRARRFAGFAADLGRSPKIADLGCGIGADLHALAAAGGTVTGFDRDALTVEVARANITALNVPQAAVRCLDVEAADRTGFDAAFLDPARRSGGRRTFDVRAYSPPWRFLTDVLATMPAAAKVAPGIAHELVPPGVAVEWVSFRGELKEAVLWSGALAAGAAQRMATLLPAGHSLVAADRQHQPPSGPPLRYLYEPDPAVVRAHLVAELAELIGGRQLDPTTAYLTADDLIATPFARAFQVEEVLPFSRKGLQQALRAQDAGSVTIMKRGSAVDVEQLRRQLRLTGGRHLVVVLALVGGRRKAVLARPAASMTPAASQQQ